MPPTMPRRAFDVLAAIASPPGTENVTTHGPVGDLGQRRRGSCGAGTGLIAGAPTGSPSPGLVMVPDAVAGRELGASVAPSRPLDDRPSCGRRGCSRGRRRRP